MSFHGIDFIPSLFRDCGSVQGTCEDESSIMYAWARNAPPTKLPKGKSHPQGKRFTSFQVMYFFLTGIKPLY